MNIALIMAGGAGSRMGTDCPKQFLELQGIPVLIHTLRTFASVADITRILVVCSEKWVNETTALVNKYLDLPLALIEFTTGGDTRRESVLAGLTYLEKSCTEIEDDIVLIHDAARPFVSAKIILDNITAVRSFGSAATVLPVQDTIATFEHNNITAVLDRSTLCTMQTPQSFKLRDIIAAHRSLSSEEEATVTDDVGVALLAGITPYIVSGEKTNFKITTKEDLGYAEFLLRIS